MGRSGLRNRRFWGPHFCAVGQVVAATWASPAAAGQRPATAYTQLSGFDPHELQAAPAARRPAPRHRREVRTPWRPAEWPWPATAGTITAGTGLAAGWRRVRRRMGGGGGCGGGMAAAGGLAGLWWSTRTLEAGGLRSDCVRLQVLVGKKCAVWAAGWVFGGRQQGARADEPATGIDSRSF